MLQPQGCTHLHVLHLDRLLVKHGHVGRLVHAAETQRGEERGQRGEEGTQRGEERGQLGEEARPRSGQARSQWVWGERRAARQKGCGSCLPCWWGPQAGPARRQLEPPSQATAARLMALAFMQASSTGASPPPLQRNTGHRMPRSGRARAPCGAGRACAGSGRSAVGRWAQHRSCERRVGGEGGVGGEGRVGGKRPHKPAWWGGHHTTACGVHTQHDHSMQRSRQLTTAYSSCGPSNVRSRLPVRISQMCATNCGGGGARQMRGCMLLSEWQASGKRCCCVEQPVAWGPASCGLRQPLSS